MPRLRTHLTVSSRYTVRTCAQVAFALGHNDTVVAYPQCIDYFNGNAPNLPVIVTADFASDNSMELSAALGIPFGAAGWLSLLLHTVAIETYVSRSDILNHETDTDQDGPASPDTQRVQSLASSLV